MLLLQAQRVREQTPVLPEPIGPRSGHEGRRDAAPLRLLVAGDSAAAGVGAARQSEALAQPLARRLARRFARGVRWQLIARTGWTSADLLQALTTPTDQVPIDPADIAAIVIGVNDLTSHVPLVTVIAQRAKIARHLHAAGVGHVSFMAAPNMSLFPTLPQPLRWFAGQMAQRNNAAQDAWAAAEPGVSHVPMEGAEPQFAADGFHPGPAVYAAMAEAFSKSLAEYCSACPTQSNSQEETH